MKSYIIENYVALRKAIEGELAKFGRKLSDITLVAVTKNATVEQIAELYDAGHREFGENYIQPALSKIEVLPKDIKWHFIGSLQKNKINKILGKFELVHSINSVEIAEAFDARAGRENFIQNVLVEVNTSGEEQKQGIAIELVKELCFRISSDCKNLRLQGLMTMAPYTDDLSVIENCFRSLSEIRKSLWQDGLYVPHLSMGMTNDWKVALKYDATILRIGTAIFGKRFD